MLVRIGLNEHIQLKDVTSISVLPSYQGSKEFGPRVSISVDDGSSPPWMSPRARRVVLEYDNLDEAREFADKLAGLVNKELEIFKQERKVRVRNPPDTDFFARYSYPKGKEAA